MPSSSPHSWLTASRRLDSSPEEYCRKKRGGRFITRDMTAASTDSEVLISSRPMLRERTVSMSSDEIVTLTRNIAVPISMGILR